MNQKRLIARITYEDTCHWYDNSMYEKIIRDAILKETDNINVEVNVESVLRERKNQ